MTLAPDLTGSDSKRNFVPVIGFLKKSESQTETLRTSAMPGLEDLVGCYPLHLAGDLQPQDPQTDQKTLRFHIGVAPPCFLRQPEMNHAAQRTAHPSPLTVRYGALRGCPKTEACQANDGTAIPSLIAHPHLFLLLDRALSPTCSINCNYDELQSTQLTP
ncbi:hypothetical protein CSKR_203729 [Clonorchis sinensis]|uniref:Uncharacterized protein n=1 Tax=Clonorchis sinensis TaxID=79923 RepID=A0A8T1N0N5_CLOSI|nr:hypothetical protein CSKR_203729 [Clonorchis sinensis]